MSDLIVPVKSDQALIRISFDGDNLLLECFADDDEMLAIAKDIQECFYSAFQVEIEDLMDLHGEEEH